MRIQDLDNNERKLSKQPAKWEVTPKVEQKYFSASEVAKILGITRQTVYKMEKSKELFGVQFGTIWRFPKNEFDAYIARKHKDSRERPHFM